MQQFAGFSNLEKSDNLPLPGMGGVKIPGDKSKFSVGSGIGKFGGGMI